MPVAIVLEVASGPGPRDLPGVGGGDPAVGGLIGRSTEQLALHTGPRVGGLINATFGNVTELIIAFFLILDDKIEIVKASLTGSIIGNLLLVLGLSFLLGGLRHKEQHYSANARLGALHLVGVGRDRPADARAVRPGGRGSDLLEREVVSGTVAAVLIALYVAALAFTLVTHEHLFHIPEEGEVPAWSKKRAIASLLGATALGGVDVGVPGRLARAGARRASGCRSSSWG